MIPALSEDQEAIRESAGRFAHERIASGYQSRETRAEIERSLCSEMGELGLIGADLPEHLGGGGLPCITAGLIMEAVAAADFNVAYVQLLTSLNGQVLANAARPELAREWITSACRGETLLCLALTEPAVGSDAAHLRFKASRHGDTYRLSGEKTSISLALQADAAVVFARTGEDGAHGITAFLVPLDRPGIRRSAFRDVGSRAVGRGALFFDEVEIPAGYRIGEEGQGFTQVMQGFDYSRALIGLQCLAAAQASLDETWAYLEQRQAFGKKLSAFQGATFPLAEYETRVRGARLLCFDTLSRKDAGEPHTREAAMTKAWAPKLAFDTIHQCLLAHGHAGYSDDFAHQQRLRDVLGLEIGDGTREIMNRIVVRERVKSL